MPLNINEIKDRLIQPGEVGQSLPERFARAMEIIIEGVTGEKGVIYDHEKLQENGQPVEQESGDLSSNSVPNSTDKK